jgi:hypothetical protein
MTKISALSDIGTSVASNDAFVLVDVSDPTTPNKKIQQQNLFLIPDGSAGTPAVRFLNDTDVGLFRPTTNTLALATGGSERLRIDSSGRVGIGTASVNALLEVNNPTAGGEVQRIEGNYSGSGSVILTNWRRAGGSVAAALKYNDDSSPLCMSIGTTTSHQFRIRTADTDAITIDTSQRVGIGTTSPTYSVEVQNTVSSDVLLRIRNVQGGEDTGLIIDGDSGGIQREYRIGVNTIANTPDLTFSGPTGFRWFTAGTEKAQIDTSGRLLVGTSSYSGSAKLVVQGDSASPTNGGHMSFRRDVTPGAAGSTIGFTDYSNTAGSTGAYLFAESDGAWTNGSSHPTRLVFSTTADGASSPTERMRITNAGILKVSNNSTYSAANIHQFNQDAGSQWALGVLGRNAVDPYGIRVEYTNAAPNGTVSQFLYCIDTAGVKAEIRSNGGLANYQANNVNLSDINTKKDISPAADTLELP